MTAYCLLGVASATFCCFRQRSVVRPPLSAPPRHDRSVVAAPARSYFKAASSVIPPLASDGSSSARGLWYTATPLAAPTATCPMAALPPALVARTRGLWHAPAAPAQNGW